MKPLRSYYEWQIGYDDAVQGMKARWAYLANAAYMDGFKAGALKAMPRYRRRFSGWWPFS